jgi:alkylated DNA nucleotide flippase Atl1
MKKKIKNFVLNNLSNKTNFEKEVLLQTFEIPRGKVSTHRVVGSKGEILGRNIAGIKKRRCLLKAEGLKFKGNKVILKGSLF